MKILKEIDLNPQSDYFATHNGVFHPDEVMSTIILNTISPDTPIIRTRNSEIIKESILAYDVGGGDYDHHQKNGNGTRLLSIDGEDYEIKLSSFGLIWNDFGTEYLKKIYPNENNNFIKDMFEIIDERIVSPIDSLDNGHLDKNGKPLLNSSYSSLINNFNPTWLEKKDDDKAFEEAVEFTKKILERNICSLESNVRAKNIILDSLEENENKFFINLGSNKMPWQETVCNYNLNSDEKIKYVIFETTLGEYMAQTVPTHPGSFNSLEFFPQEWRGLRDLDLDKKIGIDDCVFCHSNGFLIGHKNIDKLEEIVKKSHEINKSLENDNLEH